MIKMAAATFEARMMVTLATALVIIALTALNIALLCHPPRHYQRHHPCCCHYHCICWHAMKRAVTRVARAMATAMKRAMVLAAGALVTATKRARARAARGMGTSTKRAMARAA